jgi:sugar/nucleoside kinase (ribokinase family)
VIGNLNIDLIVRSVPALPEWGKEVTGTDHQTYAAGQAGYLALGLASLGASVSVIAVVGADDAGDRIVDGLAGAGVDVSAISKIGGERTGITVALVRADGERAFASDIGCSARMTEAQVRAASALVAQSSWVAVVGLFMIPEFPMAHMRALLGDCRRRGQQTMLDTGWDPRGWPSRTIDDVSALLSEVDLFLPNLDEAQAITGEAQPLAALEKLRALCPGSIVIKCGAEGSVAWHDGRVVRHAASPVTVIDTVGAGDAFNAGLLAAVGDGASIDDAIAQGHAFASIYVSRSDSRFARRTELPDATKSLLRE